MEPMAPMGSADDEVRECIRRLVAVIRRSSTGDSPVESSHVEHIKKVVRVLSLSEAQVSSMREEERTQVQKIRCNALQKFRLANSVRSSDNSSSDGAESTPGSSPTPGASPMGFSSFGSSSFSPGAPLPSSAPTTTQMQMPLASGGVCSIPITSGAHSMPPPAFYTRKCL